MLRSTAITSFSSSSSSTNPTQPSFSSSSFSKTRSLLQQRRKWFFVVLGVIILYFLFLCSSTSCFPRGHNDQETISVEDEDISSVSRSSKRPPEAKLTWIKKWVGPGPDFKPNFTLSSPLRFSKPDPGDILDFTSICSKGVPPLEVDRTKRRIFVMSMFQSSPEARAIIPYFFNHYTSLGVPPENFLITIQTPNFTHTEYLDTKKVVEKLGGTVGVVDGEYTTFLNSFAVESWWRLVPFTYHDWVIPADMDELHWYPEDLFTMLSKAEDNNWTYLTGGFVDRVRSDGEMVALEPFSKKKNAASIWDQYSLDCNLNPLTHTGRETNKGGGLNYRKVVLHRSFIVPTRGHHSVNTSIPETVSGLNNPLPLPPGLLTTTSEYHVPTYHFKWTDNAKKSIQERIDTYTRLRIPWYVASSRWLKHFKEHDGKICTECPEIQCKPGFNPANKKSDTLR